MGYIEWEIANYPERYGRLRCNQVIDKMTLTHVICNVDYPEDVKREDYLKVMDKVAETLEKVPFVEIEVPVDLRARDYYIKGKGNHDDDTLEAQHGG